MPTTIQITVSDETHDKLTDAKDGKTWEQAVKDALLQ